MTAQTEPNGPETDEALARRVLRSEHEHLRGLLAALDDRACGLIHGDALSGLDLCASLEAATKALIDHIRNEEPVVASMLPPGALRSESLARLHEDHVRQIEEIETMQQLARTSDDVISLALAIRAFVDDVRLDMDVEDRRFSLSPGTSCGPGLALSCLDCGDALAPALDRVFAVRSGQAICMACAGRRGGVYDEGIDGWRTEPRVDDLFDLLDRRRVDDEAQARSRLAR